MKGSHTRKWYGLTNLTQILIHDQLNWTSNGSLKYFGWLPAGSRSSSPDYLKWGMHPLSLKGWVLELSDYLDQIFSKYILDGITNGFRIGFSNCQTLQPAVTNLKCFVLFLFVYILWCNPVVIPIIVLISNKQINC